MDDALADRFARELADAIALAVADDPRVAACRERARAAGYELRVTLDAVVGLVRDQVAATPAPVATTRVTAPVPDNERRWSCAMTGADRRFLRSLRIAADQAQEEQR